MKLKHLKTVLEPQDGAAKVAAVAWAPNNKRFAVATADRVVQLYSDQGEKKDKFSTKPADSNLGKQSYQVTGLAFSPDSTRVAVGQSDNIAFVYTIGEAWGEKKVISGKSVVKSAVTSLIWPGSQSNYVVGLADGKVKSVAGKGSKTQTLYSSGSYVVSLAASPSGKGIISGHADGTIIRFMFEDDGSGLVGGAVVKHSCAPYALAWTASSISAAGCDRRLQFYSHQGKKLQQFDFSKDEKEKEFCCASSSPSGEAVALGSFDRVRIFACQSEGQSWEEVTVRDIPHFYTVTALSWKRDGSRLLAGSLCGAVEMFDCYLKRVIYNKKFEMTYVALSQVIVSNMSTGSRVNMKSCRGYEVKKVQVLGEERYLVGHTPHTLLLGDLASCKLSEVAWQSGGNEKFYLENENVAMIFNVGELSLVEYGVNEVLASVRTEHMSPHLISVRINERRVRDEPSCKRLAYLIDLRTVCIMDLDEGVVMANVAHDSIINWLELNETGRKLLYRDRRLKLNLYDVETQTHTSLLSYCCYVQWVPQSDVVVAQNKTSLCVWYNINSPDKATMFPLKGEVVDLERRNGRTEVLVRSGVDTVTYTLDEGLIEFGTAVDDRDYLRALGFLEGLEQASGESEAMWQTLAQLSLQDRKLKIAERCYAALGDVAKVRYLREVGKLADKMKLETGQDGTTHYLVEAKLAALNKDLKQAEAILLERGELEMVMTMYQELHRWEDAIEVAAARSHPDLATLRATHYQYLVDSGQEERAGQMREREGDLSGAVALYMKAGLPGKAAKLITQHQELLSQTDLLRHVASALSQGEQHERAGELFEKAQDLQQAMEAYRKAGAYRRAVELARSAYPTQVVTLEEEWGAHLCGRREYEAAIVHLIEAGKLEKAAEAAIMARQWSKAMQIVDMLGPEQAGEHYQLLATHFASTRDLPMAEKYFTKANMAQEAVDMYVRAGDWKSAHRVSLSCMAPEEIRDLYVAQASQMEREGRLSEAEELYLLVNEPDIAISMYKKAKQYDSMVRLVTQFHEDLLTETHLLLAQELEAEGELRQAERHFVQAEDWKAAVRMYREKGHWEDAHRVAKNGGGVSAANQVAYHWAQNLGGESAVKLLTKFGLLESAVDYATDHFAFDFAFSIAKVALKEKVAEIHLKRALHLEDEGKFREAEESFTAAGKPKEAVLMYVHQQSWDEAQRVAELHCPESVADVLIGQARAAFDQKNYQRAEAHLLRADRPDLAADYYKGADMWQDALRIVKDYLPHKLDEFQKEMAAKGGTSYRDLLSQAKTWEQNGEHSRAIDVYLQITSANCSDQDVLQDSWEKAVDLALKFTPARSSNVVSLVSDRLAHMGRFIQAGEMLLSVEMVKEGLDMYMAGEAWEKARHIAKNIAPRYVQYVEQAYVEFLREQNRPDEMQGVDPEGALRMYCEKGQWQKCLELAGKQGSVVLEKYVALYGAHLVKTNAPLTALQLFAEYGAAPNSQNFNIYKRLCEEVLAGDWEGAGSYKSLSLLRDLLLQLTEALSRSREDGSQAHRDFKRCLLVSHYLSTRAACVGVAQLGGVAAKISVSLLRYTDILPADRAFHQAGLHCKEEQREEVKEWVLAVSLDQRVEQSLPTDERGTYVASLSCPHTGVTSLPCVLTGYPVLRQKIEFRAGGRCANKEDWNKFIMTIKTAPSEECADVWRFLSQWCGIPQNHAHSFK